MTTHIHPDSQWVVPIPPQQLTPQMSLLDYFAGQALTMFAGKPEDFSAKHVAEMCYDQAIAMLKERERLQQKCAADVGQAQT